MSERHPRELPTLIGMPAFNPEEPFPLTPYADVHVYTPSGERARREATPVYIPPARRFTPEELELRRELEKTRLRIPALVPEPTALDKVFATLIVCTILLAIALFL